MLSLLLAGGLALGAQPSTTPSAATNASPGFAVRAKRLHVGDGSVIEAGTILVQDGKITACGAGIELPKGTALIEHEGDLAPGFLALHDQSGADGEVLDGTRTALPEARLAYGFDPEHSDFRPLREEGVTTVVLASPAATLVPGQTAVVKSAGGTVLRDGAQLQLTLSSGALEFGRYPTSYGSAVAELDALLGAGAGAYGRAKRGELPVLMAASEKHEILRALELAQRHGLRGALLGAPLGGELAERIASSKLAVVWQPFTVGIEERELRSLAALARAGVPLAFGLDAPANHPASLRLSAAAALRAGVDRATAMKALCATAATIAGVADRVGTLASGRDADFVLWSGDPLDLTSSVQAVYVDGRLVHGGQR